MNINNNKLKIGECIIISAAIIFALIQFFTNKSVWLDESFLGINILTKSYSELLKPLDLLQVAPIGFLLIEKFLSTIFTHDFGLRLFPLLCYIISCFVSLSIAKTLFKKTSSQKTVLVLIIFNLHFFYFANEIKQYCSDITFVLIILNFILKREQNNKSQTRFFTFLLALSAFTSNVSIFFVFPSFVYEFFFIKTNNRKNLLITYSIYLLSFLLNYMLFALNHPSKIGMIEEWTFYNGFPPESLFSIDFLKFFFFKGQLIFGELLISKTFFIINIIFISIGIFSLSIDQKKMSLLVLIISPLILHFIASYFRLYPIGLRLILYLLPYLCILLVLGIEMFVDFLKNNLIKLFFENTLKLFFCFLSISQYINQFPLKSIGSKEIISSILEKTASNDGVYFSYNAYFPMKFYAHTKSWVNEIDFKIIGGSYTSVYKDKWTADEEKFLDDLKRYSGVKFFVFSSGAEEYDKRRSFEKHCKLNRIKIKEKITKGQTELYIIK